MIVCATDQLTLSESEREFMCNIFCVSLCLYTTFRVYACVSKCSYKWSCEYEISPK